MKCFCALPQETQIIFRIKQASLTFANIENIIIKPWGCSSLGRALEWHSRGSGFDPHHLHQNWSKLSIFRPVYFLCFLLFLLGMLGESVDSGLFR